MDQNVHNGQIDANSKMQVLSLPLFKVSFEIKHFIARLGFISVIDLE